MPKKIGIITGGGDCPGLNTVIDSIVKCLDSDYQIIGFFKGFEGVYSNQSRILNHSFTNSLRFTGGTMLKSTNKGNFAAKAKDGIRQTIKPEILIKTKEVYNSHNLECLVVLGGDGTLAAADQLQAEGVNIVGVPKSIDNDLYGTELTFGFLTAVEIAQVAMDRLETTARSHDRVMVLEVMGRNAGWIGLYSGISGGANIILIPEIPFQYQRVLEIIQKRKSQGKNHSLIVVSEGAKPKNGKNLYSKIGGQSSEKVLGGIGEEIAAFLNSKNIDSRATRLGHIQRGGTPVSFDRLISVQMGAFAARLVREQNFGTMVTFTNGNVSYIPLQVGVSKLKTVDINSDLVTSARQMKISFGD